MPRTKRKNTVLVSTLKSDKSNKRVKTNGLMPKLVDRQVETLSSTLLAEKPIPLASADLKAEIVSDSLKQAGGELLRLLEKYHASFPGGYQQLFATIPVKESWRFFVDGSDQRSGETWADYNKREAGYLTAMSSAFSKMLTHIKLSGALDLSFVKSLHANATAQVSGTNYDNLAADIKSKFNRSEFDNIDEFGIDIGNVHPSKKAVKEILSRIVNGNPLLNITWRKSVNAKLEEVEFNSRSTFKPIDLDAFAAEIVASLNFRTSSVIEKKNDLAAYRIIADAYFVSMLKNHETAILEVKNPLEKLTKIVEFITECEQSHPYMDGNGRTFCTLLLNYLLIRNNFPPVIMYNPNMFDFKDVDTLILEVIKGMKNVFHLIKHDKLYHVKTDDALLKMSPRHLLSFNQSCEMLKEYFYSQPVSADEKTGVKKVSPAAFFQHVKAQQKTSADEKGDYKIMRSVK
jgi:hypothetical protein